MFSDLASISTNTGLAPVSTTALGDATKVKSGTITSSPIPTSNAFKAKNNPVVPLVTAHANLLFVISINNFSYSCVYFDSV